MSSEQSPSERAPIDRAQADHAVRVTIAVCCFFAVYGVALPYLARWLEVERGLDGAAIGAVLSTALIARVFTGPLIALWADRATDRVMVLRILGAASALAHVIFFFVAKDFWALLIAAFVALTMMQAAIPFAEAAMLRATQKGPLPYGIARGIGSLAFIFANIAGGILIARFGAGAVAIWVTATSAVYAISACFGLKPEPAPRAHEEEPDHKAQIKELLRRRRFWIVILACGLIQASHAFYYSFSTLSWVAQGLPAWDVGLLWAVAVAAEVGFLFALPWIERRISPEGLILLGGAGGALRWLCLGLAPQGLILWPLQALHACSFAAAHVAAMRLIMREAPERVHGLAQTLYGGVATGLLMGLMTLLSGWLYEHVGAQGYWAMAVLAGGGALVGLNLFGQQAWIGRREALAPD